ncbi:Do family serine endopeptidase [bacterium]|nr:Do family serine endopeptidase [bacterium]
MDRWLIVEDDFGSAEALAQTLFRAGCDVGIVHNGEDAIEAMDDTFVGTIIDLNLPDMAGDKLLKILKSKFPQKIFGLITGEAIDTIGKLARKSGADFWLTKPIDTKKLFKIIRKKEKAGGLKMLRKFGIVPAILTGLIMGAVLTLILTADFSITRETSARDYSRAMPEVSQIFADVAEEVMPSVVTITSARIYDIPIRRWSPFSGDPFFDFFFGPQRPRYEHRQYRQEGLGSGVIVSKDGYILTNAHVVDGADEIQVHIKEEEYDAKIVGVDEKTDIAVLKVNAHNLPAAKLGDSDKIRVGEWVLAIGSPFKLEHTVTAGIVSAKGRSRMGITDYEDFIQTDAAINPGNSGGALVNLKGEVIGINTAIVSGGGGSIGIGFAIPINLAQMVLDQLVEHGKVVRGWLGVSIQDVTPALADAMNMDSDEGVLVGSVVEGSPADEAGIERGDVILKIDDENIESVEQLRNRIASTEPGTKIHLTILRDGREKEISVKLGELEDDKNSNPYSSNKDEIDLGLSLKNLSYSEARRMGFRGDGVLVTGVDEGSIAHKAGVREGDIIIELNKEAVESPDDVRRIAENIRSGDTVLFVVWRDGYTMYLATRVE